MSAPFDVVIQGAGMVGLLLARALAPLGLRLALLDAQAPPRWREGEWALRVSAVTVVSERILSAVDVWDAIVAGRASPFRSIQVWDGAGSGSVRFDAAQLGEPHLGHIVENVLVQTALLERLRRDDISLMLPAAVAGIEPRGEILGLTLEDGRRLSTRLLVGADGAGSPVRALAGIALDRGDYGQLGLVGVVRPERHHGEIARQRFLPGGPLALLPLRDGRCSIVWSQPEAEARARLEAPEQAFLAELTEASAGLLGEMLECGPRGAFPLRYQHARRYCAERVALVGDAAHVIHPLAGQGANMGFLDAAVLAEEIAAAHRKGRDVGGQAVLRRYERRRKGENLLMQSAMDGFHWLFGSASPWLALPRSLGLDLTDRLPPAKAFFMRRAMGFGGELPELARNVS